MTQTVNQLLKAGYSNVIVPSLLTLILFIVAVFGITLPTLRTNLIEQKKKQTTILTQTTWNVLAHFEREVAAENMSLETAQFSAKEQIRSMRYGPDGKGYFWINDLRPFMVMHPYLPELEGQDLSGVTGRNGTSPFQAFVNEAKRQGEGFVPYLWQWNDESGRIAPKLSYIKSFKPWGWIIGTGMYTDDVNNEIKDASKKLIFFSTVILTVVALLLARIIVQSRKEIQKKQRAEAEVQAYQNKLERLVEERTAELNKTLEEIKTLRGILPLCSFCKKIRDDQGYWNQVDVYIQQHSEADISHGICPDCLQQHYPKLGQKHKHTRKPIKVK